MKTEVTDREATSYVLSQLLDTDINPEGPLVTELLQRFNKIGWFLVDQAEIDRFREQGHDSGCDVCGLESHPDHAHHYGNIENVPDLWPEPEV